MKSERSLPLPWTWSRAAQRPSKPVSTNGAWCDGLRIHNQHGIEWCVAWGQPNRGVYWADAARAQPCTQAACRLLPGLWRAMVWPRPAGAGQVRYNLTSFAKQPLAAALVSRVDRAWVRTPRSGLRCGIGHILLKSAKSLTVAMVTKGRATAVTNVPYLHGSQQTLG
jgi:hypothetical protein